MLQTASKYLFCCEAVNFQSSACNVFCIGFLNFNRNFLSFAYFSNNRFFNDDISKTVKDTDLYFGTQILMTKLHVLDYGI